MQELSKTALRFLETHLEVGDRGATVAFQTPCFHVNLHCVAFHTVATPTVLLLHRRVPARNTARLESLATIRAPSFAGSSTPDEIGWMVIKNKSRPGSWLNNATE